MSKYDCLDEEIGEVSDEGHVAFSIERVYSLFGQNKEPIKVAKGGVHGREEVRI